MALSVIVVSLLTIFIAYKLFQRFRFKLPPGPRPLPFVGNIYNLKPVLVRCFTEWSQVYGPIFSVYLGSQLSIIVNSAELAKQVLNDNDRHLANRHRSTVTNVLTKNGVDLIWSDYGPHYVKVRKLCNVELFSTKRTEALRPIREDEVAAMVESIFKDSVKPENKGKGLVLREYLGMMAFIHITRLSYGKRFVDSDGGVDKLGQELKDIEKLQRSRAKGPSDFLPRMPFLVKAEDQTLAERGARSDNFTKKIMEEYSIERNRTGGTKSHFVDALLTLRKEYELSEDTVLALIWDMLAAGADTVTITIEWAMAEMIRNPRVQHKVREELHRVVGSDRIMTEADIPNLPYLQCVTKECFRMHPPTPLMLPHKASTKVTIGGFDIPKGAIVNVNVWAIARDPTVWKNPLEFRPERFQEEDIDMKGTDYRLLPFGSGRRVCPGAQMAINLVTSTLGHMLHHFDWAPPAGIRPEDMDMMEKPGVVAYMRTPVRAVATPRLPANLFKRVAVDGNI